MNYPKLHEPILLSLMAALCFLLAWKQDHYPDWLRSLLVFAGLVFMLWAIFTTIDVIVYRTTMRFRDRRMAEAKTERVLLLEAIRHMDQNQIHALSQYVPIFELIGGSETGPLMYLRTFNENVPVSFISEFLSLGDELYMCPVGHWSEGTRERAWAESFTRYAISMGWAGRAAGPYPAKWIKQDLAYTSLGYEVVYEKN
jgi:hypothetical protein